MSKFAKATVAFCVKAALIASMNVSEEETSKKRR
jgi:hypothetical protein